MARKAGTRAAMLMFPVVPMASRSELLACFQWPAQRYWSVSFLATSTPKCASSPSSRFDIHIHSTQLVRSFRQALPAVRGRGTGGVVPRLGHDRRPMPDATTSNRSIWALRGPPGSRLVWAGRLPRSRMSPLQPQAVAPLARFPFHRSFGRIR